MTEITVEATGETVGEAKWSALRELERRESLRARQEAKTADEARAIAARLEATELRFDANAGPTGSLFGSVTATNGAGTVGSGGSFTAQAEAAGYASLWTFQRLIVPEGSAMEPVYHSVLDPMVALGESVFVIGPPLPVTISTGMAAAPCPGNQKKVTWTGSAVLLGSLSQGPASVWTPVAGATSPYCVAPGGGANFFRVTCPLPGVP